MRGHQSDRQTDHAAAYNPADRQADCQTDRQAAVIHFTSRGGRIAQRVQHFYEERGWNCMCRSGQQTRAAETEPETKPETKPETGSKMKPEIRTDPQDTLQEWIGKRFADSSVIVFVGALGIAVRLIAPFLVDKRTDPAVLCGEYVISVVSGHIGGGNRETRLLADRLGAAAVITTATDLNGLFAVDVFAAENKLTIRDMKAAKQISAFLLEGGSVRIGSLVPVEGALPAGVESAGRIAPGEGRYVTVHACENPWPRDPGLRNARVCSSGFRDAELRDPGLSLELLPRSVVLGAGCRKGTDPEKMERFLTDFLDRAALDWSAVSCLASIDLKKDEKALTETAARHQIPFRTFSPEELKKAEGNFSASEFVRQTTGADNVCERSAVCAAGGGPLFLKKTAFDGMTAAAALPDQVLYF